MTAKQFLQRMKKGEMAAGYAFLGNELFYRDRCRAALAKAVLGDDWQSAGSTEGLTEIDLAQHPLAQLLDEASALSLFAPARLIAGYNAEACLPAKAGHSPESAALRQYFKNPAPGVVLLFEATKFDWSDRDDKAKLERLEKVFSAAPHTVRLERLTPAEAASAAKALAAELNLKIPGELLAELVEMLGSDMGRLANELEKLAVYAGEQGEITRAELEILIPEARQSGVYEFSDALAQRDRRRALDILDTLARSGEYFPMQINLLAALFRQALAVKEQRLRSVPEVMRLFQRYGVRIWPARAQQILQVARKFSLTELERALGELFCADRDLRRERPEDRLIMEQLVVSLTS